MNVKDIKNKIKETLEVAKYLKDNPDIKEQYKLALEFEKNYFDIKNTNTKASDNFTFDDMKEMMKQEKLTDAKKEKNITKLEDIFNE